MNEQDKTREQLIAELAQFHGLVAGLRQEHAKCRSEGQRLESALQQSDRRFKALLYNLPEKVFHKDRESVYVSCNRNYAVDCGLEPEQMVGKTDFDLFPPDIAAKYRADDSRIMASGGIEEIEEDYCTTTGQVRRIRTVKAALRDEHGQVTGILGIFSDITERKRAEQALQKARDELERRVAERTAELTDANQRLQREVEERMRIEAALRQSEERYELAFRGTGVGIWDWDLRTGKVYYSPRWKMLFGYEAHEVGDSFEYWTRLLHPDEREGIIKFQEEFLAGTAPTVTAEYRLRHKDGSYRWISAHGLVVRDEQGKACRLIGSHGDITDRKQAEEALRQSEAKYRALVESCPDAVVMLDLEGRVVFASQLAAKQHGVCHPSELVGRPATDFVVEAERDKFRASIGRLIAEGIHRNVQYKGLRSDGTTFDAEVTSAVIRDAAGNPEALMGVYRDVSDRKRAVEAIAESEAKYRHLVETTDTGFLILDEQGRVADANDEYVRLSGHNALPEILGRSVVEWTAPHDVKRNAQEVERCLVVGNVRHLEIDYARGDGLFTAVEINASVVETIQGRRVLSLCRDITERKQAEARLRAKEAELFAAAEIQAHLLPQESPQLPGLDIAGHCYPAEVAAGDHFDYLWLPDASLLVVVGDVSGHGIGPALVATDFCARLRTLSESPCELGDMAVKVNAGLYGETTGEIFVTAILGRIDPQSRSLTYLNAGHPPALVLDSAGEVKARLASGSLPFAIQPRAAFRASDSVELNDGDLIFFYTDGLLDAHRAGEPLFGIERAIQTVQANRKRTAVEIVEALYRAACQYAGTEKPDDDITVVIVKVLARSSQLSPAPRDLDGFPASPSVMADSGTATNLLGTGSFSVEQCGEVTIVRFVHTKYFDTGDYARLQQDLLDFVERQQPRKLAADLSNLVYASSALISTLLMAQKRLQAGAGTMKLFGLSESLLETLQQLKLVGTLLSVYADEMAAINAF